MFAKLKTAALAALIGLGAVAAIPATAQADNIYLNYGNRHGGIGMQVGDYDRVDYRRHDRRYDRRYRECTPNRAIEKAERNGLRRARVVDVSRRTITVAGRKWGERVRMTFSRAPNCPVVRW